MGDHQLIVDILDSDEQDNLHEGIQDSDELVPHLHDIAQGPGVVAAPGDVAADLAEATSHQQV